MEDVQKVMEEIKAEIGCARCNWDADFDNNNTLNDWVAYTTSYLGSAVNFRLPVKEQRAQLVKAAGLLISALAAQDRNGEFAARHYE